MATTELVTHSVKRQAHEGSGLLPNTGQTDIINAVQCICGESMTQGKIGNDSGSAKCANINCTSASLFDSNGLCYYCPSQSTIASQQHPNGFYYCSTCAAAVAQSGFKSQAPDVSDFRNVTNDVSPFTILQLIFWKNFQTQVKRRKCICCCKVCCPITFILIMGILGALRPALQYDVNCEKEDEYDWNSPCLDIYMGDEVHNMINKQTFTSEREFIPEIICEGYEWDWTIDDMVDRSHHQPQYIGIVWDQTNTDSTANTHIQSVVNIIGTHYGSNGYEYDYNETAFECDAFAADPARVNWTEGSLLKYFTSSDELDAYVRDDYYGADGYTFNNDVDNALRPVAAAIAFKSVSLDGKVWHYSLRFHDDQIVNTFDDNEFKIVNTEDKDTQSLADNAATYKYSGFIGLQTMVDNAITEHITTLQIPQNTSVDRTYLDFAKGYFVFPASHQKVDFFWSIMQPFFIIFAALMFLFPVLFIIYILVSEKAAQIREGMKMMGASTWIYWISMYLWFTLEFTLICVAVVGFGYLTNVFIYSNGWIILIWFWLFCLSQMAFSTLISVLFDNSKTSIIVGFVLYIVFFSLSFAMSNFSENQKRAFCLLSTPCFTDSLNVVIHQEIALIGVQWDNLDHHYSQMSMRTSLNMLFIDTILYILLAMYLDNVWPSRFGQRKSPFFCLKKSFWSCCCKSQSRQEVTDYNNISKLSEDIANYEKYNNVDDNPAIVVRDLHKTFDSGFRSRAVRAVQGISLDIYHGEVFCLLGHNGAGKTTTINMLSGLLSSTGGASYINGYNVDENMNAIRKFLGVCPQHDVLWDKLTSAEHLRFFAQLKGVPKDDVQTEINRVLNLFDMMDSNLWGKFPPTMSGGERRRLSLAIALIGGSQIVFLDEPTSGMDPENRRKMWDIIEQEKKKRCIILTTHYMDEADTLGDRIAIMSSGQIECCGSALYLKRLYGVGYTFTVSLQSDVDIHHIAAAVADDEKKDSSGTIKDAIDDILSDIQGVQTVSAAASEILYKLPFASSSSFGSVFSKLDYNRETLKIETFGVSVTTLEEVFLKIGNTEKEKENEFEKPIKFERQATLDVFEQPAFKLERRNAVWIFFMHIYAILYKRFWWSLRDISGIICQIVLPSGLIAMLFATGNVTFQLYQPELQLSPQQYVDEYTDSVVVPLSKADDDIWNVTSAYYMNDMATFYDENMATDFGNQQLYLIGNASASPQCLNDEYSWLYPQDTTDNDYDPYGSYNSYNYYGSSDPTCTNDFKLNIYDASNDKNTPYFAFYVFPWKIINWYDEGMALDNEVLFGLNVSAYHSLPIAYNVWNNWVLRQTLSDDTVQINVYSHPLPVTKKVESAINQQVSNAYVINLVIAFTFIPASSLYYIVNEKTVGTKHQQYVSGISIASYWIGSFISDILLGVPASSIVIALVYIFDVEELKGDALMPFYVTLILFVAAAIAASYLLYPFFKSPGKAQFIVIVFNVLLGVIFHSIAESLEQFNANTSNDLRSVVRFLPIFLLAENISAIFNKPFDDPDKGYWHEDVTGRNIKLMIAEACGYFALIICIEYAMSFPSLLAKLGFVVDQPRKLMRLDEDVTAEQERIKRAIDPVTGRFDPEAIQDTVVLAGLRKVYKGENKFSPYKPAVRDMFFGVKQGQVFGFLGVNGAGKTSTLQLLIGQNYPSAGSGYINGRSIVTEQLAIRRNIGFCPQNDALFDLLTGYEHLKFYAIIKGLSGSELNKQIDVLLTALTLNKYSTRTSTTYSGGNKRKLCVAQSMIGNPPVIFLDEPSTGMDPVSRRFMWKFISDTMAGRAVILTTHSMEECEALCDRVGIMVAGQLSCIGSPQYLKSKFGKGFQLDITLSDAANISGDNNVIHQLLEEFNRTFPTTILQQNGNKLLMEIREYDDSMSKLSALGQMFVFVENLKDTYYIISYALSQTSLEQVFLKMAEAKGKTEAEGDFTQEQKELLKIIKLETKEKLLQRIAGLNRDQLEQFLENEVRTGSQYVIRTIAQSNEAALANNNKIVATTAAEGPLNPTQPSQYQ